jgi:hypothetical protein
MEVIAKAGYPTNAEIFRTNDSTENDGSVGFFLSPPASELLKDKLSSLDAKLCEKPDTSVLKRVHPKCTS